MIVTTISGLEATYKHYKDKYPLGTHGHVVCSSIPNVKNLVETYLVELNKEIQDSMQDLPVMHIKREIQVTMQNFNQLRVLAKEGVIVEWSFDSLQTPTISVKLSDNHTIVVDNGWLIQDTEGRWWGMDNDYHRMLEHYGKIVKE